MLQWSARLDTGSTFHLLQSRPEIARATAVKTLLEQYMAQSERAADTCAYNNIIWRWARARLALSHSAPAHITLKLMMNSNWSLSRLIVLVGVMNLLSTFWRSTALQLKIQWSHCDAGQIIIIVTCPAAPQREVQPMTDQRCVLGVYMLKAAPVGLFFMCLRGRRCPESEPSAALWRAF